ncbi:MAG TPA: hypothetical protein VIV61_10495 [Candidatus Ozemobacteraceae bacterium]
MNPLFRWLAVGLLLCLAAASAHAQTASEPESPIPETQYPESLNAIDEFLSDSPVASAAPEPASAGWMPLPVLSRPVPAETPEIGRKVVPQGKGTLDVVITTVREKTPRQISIMPSRIEIWTRDQMIASLENGEPGVENGFHRRVFSFPPITLPAGYYHLTIRGFAEGFVTREMKWKGRIIQVGIHDGKTTRLREQLAMFVW